MAAKKADKEPPIFIYGIDVNTVECYITKKDHKVVEGDPGNIQQYHYILGLQRHPNPDLATTGHYWKIRELMQTGVFKQLI